MNGRPFFSVVIPLYNKEQYIKKTLDSVLNQTFSDFEIIIVDDGSKDKSCEIVESINDPSICLIYQENAGPSRARNRGIQEAKGQFIAFLDADDEWLPEKLQDQYELHSEHPEIVWSCGGYKVVGGMKSQTVLFHLSGLLEDSIDALVDGLSIWTSTVVIRRDVFQNERLYFNEDIRSSEDREVWYKMVCLYPKIGYIGKQLSIYNIKINGSLTNTAMKKEDFSFLSLQARINKELNDIDEKRRDKLIGKISSHNQSSIIGVWRDKKEFSNYSKLFNPFMDEKQLKILNFTSFLPVTIKKIILKVIG